MILPTNQSSSVNEGFYSLPQGFRMFDDSLWTKSVSNYLAAEKELINSILSTGDITSLFVVGCGPGLYSDVATKFGVEYQGLDIVSCHPKSDLVIYNSAIENFKPGNVSSLSFDVRRLAVFPFNCLGNIEETVKAVRTAALFSTEILISGFRPNATVERMDYYRACGNSDLSVHSEKEGTRIKSAEGLNSVAFRSLYIERIARLCGLEIETTESETIGSFAILRSNYR
jgi:hypothetical protein